jgi:hypothetical protein
MKVRQGMQWRQQSTAAATRNQKMIRVNTGYFRRQDDPSLRGAAVKSPPAPMRLRRAAPGLDLDSAKGHGGNQDQ